jgi:hypothetical protein
MSLNPTKWIPSGEITDEISLNPVKWHRSKLENYGLNKIHEDDEYIIYTRDTLPKCHYSCDTPVSILDWGFREHNIWSMELFQDVELLRGVVLNNKKQGEKIYYDLQFRTHCKYCKMFVDRYYTPKIDGNLIEFNTGYEKMSIWVHAEVFEE